MVDAVVIGLSRVLLLLKAEKHSLSLLELNTDKLFKHAGEMNKSNKALLKNVEKVVNGKVRALSAPACVRATIVRG